MTFYFAIPLKSRYATNNWPLVERLFNQTITSICGQLADDYRILVACHEIPQLYSVADSRIEFLRADYEPPKYEYGTVPDRELEHARLTDKGAKVGMLASKLHEYGGGYVMFVDADDLISRRIVEYVLNDRNPNGYIVRRGYEYSYRENKLRKEYWFSRICGSSLILKLSKEDLSCSSGLEEKECFFRKLMSRGHYYVDKHSRENGRPLKTVPFYGAMYVIDTGENQSQVFNNIGWKRRLLRALSPSFSPSEEIKREFGLG